MRVGAKNRGSESEPRPNLVVTMGAIERVAGSFGSIGGPVLGEIGELPCVAGSSVHDSHSGPDRGEGVLDAIERSISRSSGVRAETAGKTT